MNMTTLSDRDIEALVSGESHGKASDVRLLGSYLSEVRASFAGTPPPHVGRELAALLSEGLPTLAEGTIARRSKAPASRETLRTWWRRASMRVGVGAVGLVGFCAGMGAANALPAPAQLVVSRVAHAFSIDMPSPDSGRPGTGAGQVTATTVPVQLQPEHAPAAPASAAAQPAQPAPEAHPAAGASGSGAAAQSSGNRRGRTGRGGPESSPAGARSSTADTGAGDVRRADDTANGTTETTEVENHAEPTGDTPTDVSNRPAGAGSGGGGAGDSSATTIKAASVSGSGH